MSWSCIWTARRWSRTEGLHQCQLTVLNQELDFPGSVGYGIGDNIYQARLNAINASHFGRAGKGQYRKLSS
ncbi:MAG: hypothetical protein ACLUOI_24085 [Eisenbergiella sp.]